MRKLTTPLTEEDVKSLHAGEHVLLSGVVYTARDAAHLRMMDLIRAGKPLPVDLAGQVIYYAGPTPTPPGRPVGSIDLPPRRAWIPPPRRFCSTVCVA